MSPTPRQLEALAAWIQYGGAEEAAEALNLSVLTVKSYLTICREAFGVSKTAQAFGIAVQLGLIDPHELHIETAA